MGLELNTIITLENGEKYTIIQETMNSGKKYFLALKNDSNQETVIFEEELEGLDIYVRKVLDSDMLNELTKLMKH